jgi:hypothetical protein
MNLVIAVKESSRVLAWANMSFRVCSVMCLLLQNDLGIDACFSMEIVPRCSSCGSLASTIPKNT